MPSKSFDESLIDRETPWAACAALDKLRELSVGGVELHEGVNWAGVVFTCAQKAVEACDRGDDMIMALGWAHLAVGIRESLANAMEGDTWGTMHGAMVLRTNLIIRYGSVPNDRLCDVRRVIDWCFQRSEVSRFLAGSPPPRFAVLDPEVKQVGEIIESLARANRIRVEGKVAQFLDAMTASKRAN